MIVQRAEDRERRDLGALDAFPDARSIGGERLSCCTATGRVGEHLAESLTFLAEVCGGIRLIPALIETLPDSTGPGATEEELEGGLLDLGLERVVGVQVWTDRHDPCEQLGPIRGSPDCGGRCERTRHHDGGPRLQ